MWDADQVGKASVVSENGGLPELHNESSQASKSASRFHRGGLVDRSLESTCSSAFRFVSMLAWA